MAAGDLSHSRDHRQPGEYTHFTGNVPAAHIYRSGFRLLGCSVHPKVSVA